MGERSGNPANALGIAPTALTVTEIADRADTYGVDTTRLRRLREDVREEAAAVLKRGRRVASLARYHQGLLNELMGILFDQPGATLTDGRPHLLDAEA